MEKLVFAGNELSVTYPEIASEWDYEANFPVTPDMVTYGNCRTKFAWICEVCGNHWETTISSRVRGSRCPRCNSIGTSFPEQAILYYVSKAFKDAINRDKSLGKELDIFIPSINVAIEFDGLLYHNSFKKLENDNSKDELCKQKDIHLFRFRDPVLPATDYATQIICKDGNVKSLEKAICQLLDYLEVDNGFVNLESDKFNILAAIRKGIQKNSLAENFPNLAKEWHPTKNEKLTPNMVAPYTSIKVWWKCDNGHEWLATVRNRTNGNGCPYCTNQWVLKGYNDFGTKHPNIASEWHPTKNGNITPFDVTSGTNKKYYWLGRCGHEWSDSVSHRVSGRNCPICSGNIVVKGVNDLATMSPKLAEEWHPIKNGETNPSDVTFGSTKKVWWKCKMCGGAWQDTVAHRNSGRGCPICAGKQLLVGFNDFESCFPLLASEWHPTKNGDLLPSKIIKGSSIKRWWRCENGHEYEMSPYRRSLGHGCPTCALKQSAYNKKQNKINNITLADAYPSLAKEWDYDKNEKSPSDFSPRSSKSVFWKCKNGHSWEASINTRVAGNKCPYCANRKVLKGYNDLLSHNPQVAQEWHPTRNGSLQPDQVVYSSGKRIWWKCKKCGNEWETRVIDRTNGSGCAKCYHERRKSGNNDI